ncbi:MAG: PEP-CTERM sorting domain-containing protein [Phenylobacterium sp.]|uniref:PEPxxWA-CTERM sorting domain-containing protein n=1 Tax=Phenylobacterium sp. TaxID=1871053 RepID=UPI00120E1196|nr:PEPxxWA-CTERM sorting domain-containing protein [Phenylobacterium sp.]TAJ71331.1 MAG: PEP-CTERM sorting domain-containing protein [Phenylobacterium sp.]
MKMRMLLAASAALGLTMAASSANALITVAGTEQNDLYGNTLAAHGQTMLYDFDAIAVANVSFTGGTEITTTPDPISTSAPPPLPLADGGVPVTSNANPAGTVYVDPTDYMSVGGGGSATFAGENGNFFRSFSFYMGSPDTYNKVTFHLRDGTTKVLEGTAIWGGNPAGDGNRENGYRVYYDFGGSGVDAITFESSQNSFEFDGLAGTLGVPEPGTWALMIMGFGGAGAMIRRRKMAVA